EHGRLRQPHYIAEGQPHYIAEGQPHYIAEGQQQGIAEEMRGLERWLLEKGKSKNTVANYLRILRSIYREVAGEDDDPEEDILELCAVGNQPTRGVNGKGLELIPELEGLRLEAKGDLDWGRDLFLMSFYAGGMPIGTLATLRRVAPGVYVYGDDGKKALVACKQLERLLQKYGGEGSRYALPILERAGRGTASSKVEYAGKVAARALAEVGTRIGVPWLSMKNARSLAAAAQQQSSKAKVKRQKSRGKKLR
ncbi:MAG: hypothetical protein LIO90_06580, partial [Bacteroidales bacterium]|nr:hypothetical protein [Bacteroidales bacterium]